MSGAQGRTNTDTDIHVQFQNHLHRLKNLSRGKKKYFSYNKTETRMKNNITTYNQLEGK